MRDRSTRTTFGVVLVIAVATLLFACGGSSVTAPGDTAHSSPPSSPLASTSAPSTTIVVATAVDSSGEPQGVATSFPRTTSRVVIVVPVQGVAADRTLSYTRYLEGRYLDTRSAKIAKPSKYFLFETVAKAATTLVPGHFRYQIYLDGSFRGAVEFDVT